MKQGGVRRKRKEDRGEGWRKQRKTALETEYVGEKKRQSNERQRKEREVVDLWLWSLSLQCRQGGGEMWWVREGGRGGVGGLFVREDVFPQMQCLHAAVCERARCVCLRERLRVISTGKSLFSQSSEEQRRKGKAIFIQIQLQLEGESRLREVEEQKGGGGGGGKDVVICLRDYKECWQNMTADCARASVCVRHGLTL